MIFSLKNLKLKTADQKTATFESFYPHADIKHIDLAIVCTQDCDIEPKNLKIAIVDLRLITIEEDLKVFQGISWRSRVTTTCVRLVSLETGRRPALLGFVIPEV